MKMSIEILIDPVGFPTIDENGIKKECCLLLKNINEVGKSFLFNIEEHVVLIYRDEHAELHNIHSYQYQITVYRELKKLPAALYFLQLFEALCRLEEVREPRIKIYLTQNVT